MEDENQQGHPSSYGIEEKITKMLEVTLEDRKILSCIFIVFRNIHKTKMLISVPRGQRFPNGKLSVNPQELIVHSSI